MFPKLSTPCQLFPPIQVTCPNFTAGYSGEEQTWERPKSSPHCSSISVPPPQLYDNQGGSLMGDGRTILQLDGKPLSATLQKMTLMVYELYLIKKGHGEGQRGAGGR